MSLRFELMHLDGHVRAVFVNEVKGSFHIDCWNVVHTVN